MRHLALILAFLLPLSASAEPNATPSPSAEDMVYINAQVTFATKPKTAHVSLFASLNKVMSNTDPKRSFPVYIEVKPEKLPSLEFFKATSNNETLDLTPTVFYPEVPLRNETDYGVIVNTAKLVNADYDHLSPPSNMLFYINPELIDAPNRPSLPSIIDFQLPIPYNRLASGEEYELLITVQEYPVLTSHKQNQTTHRALNRITFNDIIKNQPINVILHDISDPAARTNSYEGKQWVLIEAFGNSMPNISPYDMAIMLNLNDIQDGTSFLGDRLHFPYIRITKSHLYIINNECGGYVGALIPMDDGSLRPSGYIHRSAECPTLSGPPEVSIGLSEGDKAKLKFKRKHWPQDAEIKLENWVDEIQPVLGHTHSMKVNADGILEMRDSKGAIIGKFREYVE